MKSVYRFAIFIMWAFLTSHSAFASSVQDSCLSMQETPKTALMRISSKADAMPSTCQTTALSNSAYKPVLNSVKADVTTIKGLTKQGLTSPYLSYFFFTIALLIALSFDDSNKLKLMRKHQQ